MAFIPRPMFAPGVGGLGAYVLDTPEGIDGPRKMVCQCFGYGPDASIQGALPYLHEGRGRVAVRCEASGELFPESRIRKDWQGRNVGDIYLTTRPRSFPIR